MLSLFSEPNIAFTPNLRYGVTLFLLFKSFGDDVGVSSDAESTPLTNVGTVEIPSPGIPTAAVGRLDRGLDINADWPSRNKFSTRNDADDVTTGCGTRGKVRKKL